MPTRRRILIVDDDEGIREVLSDFFETEGFEVWEAANGNEALEMAMGKPFDVVLTDLKMPDPNGIEVLKQIRDISAGTAVFILTGYPSPETEGRALGLDVDGYISKPVDLSRLKHLIVSGLIRRKWLTESQ